MEEINPVLNKDSDFIILRKIYSNCDNASSDPLTSKILLTMFA